MQILIHIVLSMKNCWIIKKKILISQSSSIPKEGDTAEREAEIQSAKYGILSGKGPDLFIMEGNRIDEC